MRAAPPAVGADAAEDVGSPQVVIRAHAVVTAELVERAVLPAWHVPA